MTTRSRRPALVRGVLLATVLAALSGTPATARQFRAVRPIATPGAEATVPPGARPVPRMQALTREQVEPLARRVVAAWNTPKMAQTLAESFYDRSRLLDTVDGVVPREATLRLQAVQGVQTLQQYLRPSADGDGEEQVSIVSATVRAQLEFNAPGGFRRVSGTTELLLEVTEPAP